MRGAGLPPIHLRVLASATEPWGAGQSARPSGIFWQDAEGLPMIVRVDEHERTMAFADIALGQIKALRQSATPRNYEIWYAYATGYHPSLNQRINEILKEKSAL